MSGAPASSRSGRDAGTVPPHGRRPRLMIVDDSIVARAVLSRMIDSDGGFEIVAVAGTAEDAIAALAHVRVDVILLDLEMPGAGGLKSIPRILAAARGAQVLIVSSQADEGAEETVAALALGAADTLPKPGAGRFHGRFSEILLDKLRALGCADFVPGPTAPHVAPALRPLTPGPGMA
ncbi:MAG: response regulator, partial [Sphingomonas bacterium]|nr:response regulator [Sphingomonas bacterium]